MYALMCVYISLPVLKASNFLKRLFLEFACGGLLTIKQDLKIKMEEFTPPETCPQCKSSWEHSGLKEALKDTNWHELVSDSYTEYGTVWYNYLLHIMI